MEIEFIKFKRNDHWVSGLINDGEFHFESKLFDERSSSGINKGRVSKLIISIGDGWNGWDNCIVNYDRGWDVEPETSQDNEILGAVLEFLENAPRTRF